MNAPTTDRWTAPARARAVADTAAIGTPLAIVATIAAARFAGIAVAVGVALVAALAIAVVAWRRARRHDATWLVRGLDAARHDMEDSADLIFAAPATLTPLQHLQQARLLERLAADAAPDLRPRWSMRTIAAAWFAGALAAVALTWHPAEPALAPATEGLPAAPGIPRLTGQRPRVTPPAYTGLPPRELTTLDARAPEGSRIAWTLAFAPAPDGAALAFHDGARIPLARDGERWHGATTLARSTLYRVVPQGTDRMPPLHRLDAIPDRAPQVTTRNPTLTRIAPGQRIWTPAFAATDDYGVAARAALRITLAQGDGENVAFRERIVGTTGTGPPRARRFVATIDLSRIGFDGVGDLIVQLTVTDAVGHRISGPSLILRRPSPRPEQGTGLDGAVKKALPAYFRSQRQIIIDAEALIRERPRLAADRFGARSDAIGVDQRMLRMRYGQFLGEESEGPSAALPTSDAEHTPDDGHDHGEAMGRDTDVVADYGHTHDEPEAATLLDPETRETLRGALDQMWQSERHLRQGDPAGALPYANRALVLIKRVQQATRIFLARTASAQPAIDETRRMTGKRDGLAATNLTLAPPAAPAPEPAATWRALATSGPVDLGALDRWLRGGGRIDDRLALAGAIDALRRDPACEGCRAALRAQLWRALPLPTPRVARRAAGDAEGRRYLDTLAR